MSTGLFVKVGCTPSRGYPVDFIAPRDRLYEWLRRCLIGPGARFESELEDLDLQGIRPLDRYQSGILYPILRGEEGIDPASTEGEWGNSLSVETEEDEAGGVAEEEDDTGTDSLHRPKRRYVPPSSVGFSFFIRGGDIRLQLIPRAVRYQYQKGKRGGVDSHFAGQRWSRLPLGANDSEVRNVRAPSDRQTETWRESVFEGRGELFALWRPMTDGWLVTVSLSNTQVLPLVADPGSWNEKRNESAFFEVTLECVIDSGEVGPYPRVH